MAMRNSWRTWRSAASLVAVLAGVALIAIGTSDARSSVIATLPFSDGFSAVDGSELSDFWIDQRGNVTVVGGEATGTGGGVNLSTLDGVSAADVKVAGDVALGASESAGLVARYSGPLEHNFYLGLLAGTGSGFRATIWKNVGGSMTKLNAGLTVGSGNGTLEFVVVGSSLKLIFNGQLVAFAHDLSLGGGSVGIRLGADAGVDNFAAEAWSPSVASLPFSDSFSTTSVGSQLDRSWIDRRGNVTVVGGEATGTGGGVNLSTLDGVSAADVKVAGDVALGASESAGLVARYSGPLEHNFYLGLLAGTGSGFRATIWKNVGGSMTKLNAGLTVGSGNGTLEFVVVGSSLKLIFNGQLVAFAHDLSLIGGSVGIRLGADAGVDNFAAEAWSPSVASLPFSDSFSTTSVGSQLDRSWIDRRGNVTVVGGEATGTGGGVNLSTLDGVNAANVAASGPIVLTAGQKVGLVTRYSGPLERNFYLGLLTGTGSGFRATIWKNVGGSMTKLSTGPTVGSGNGTLEFREVGSTLTLSLDGNVLATAVDASLGPGSVGIYLGPGTSMSSFQAS
jgi:hypothetical protein